MVDSDFRRSIELLMARVPEGSVTTYGDLAAMIGRPLAGRFVGGVAHTGAVDLPWHRLVNRFGRLASGYPGGRAEQARQLEREGIACSDDKVEDFEDRRWRLGSL